ncbi:phytanoyl-CoA dioxygenase family protein [Streptomyces sp. SCL15-4]|uniref:phytanoyl-CoA dioxygenase family protein n=1 Tax=Streptomyces sp. SCL15-4 TaxID=2967221 RepID=UPI0029671868|nr:phytanoyl-CoA dioxygenase family protein [Streptomyces sp. SCL15-4]
MTPPASAAVLEGFQLTAEQSEQFASRGYLVLPAFLPPDLVARLKPEVDHWVDQGHRARSIASCVDPDRHGVPPVMELELPAHGELIGHRPLLAVISQLMGGDFVFHHLHSDRQAPDVPGKPWHHDFEQGPATDRSALMVHALHYLDGLDTSVSSLAVLPGSHRENTGKSALAHHGTDPLPGEAVVDSLPAGSTVLLHSALFHARRPRPDRTGKPRYFVDASYCSTGTVWPPVKPYWRHMLTRARELGLGDVRWPELFAERHFTEYGHDH